FIPLTVTAITVAGHTWATACGPAGASASAISLSDTAHILWPGSHPGRFVGAAAASATQQNAAIPPGHQGGGAEPIRGRHAERLGHSFVATRRDGRGGVSWLGFFSLESR